MELWYTEKHTPGAGLTLRCRKTLFSTRTRYQRIDIIESDEYGRVLLLDGLVMTTERDEFIYHEMLVHPPMHYHGAARNILVVGGGDGGAVRELVRYPSVRKITLCEIDSEVVDASRKFFPEISRGLDDSRVEIVFADGSQLLRGKEGEFDIIIVDSTDPVGAAKALFTHQFYNSCRKALDRHGLLCAQSESPMYHLSAIREIKRGLLSAGFSFVRFYCSPVPTYPGGYWSWVMAGNGKFQREKVARVILPEEEYQVLKYFNLDIGQASFCLPNFFIKAIGTS